MSNYFQIIETGICVYYDAVAEYLSLANLSESNKKLLTVVHQDKRYEVYKSTVDPELCVTYTLVSIYSIQYVKTQK